MTEEPESADSLGPPFVRLDVFTTAFEKRENGATVLYQVAGAGSRAAAASIDLIIQAFVAVLFYSWFIQENEILRDELRSPWAASALAFEWHVVYLMLFESFTGGLTPGKKLLGLRVCRLRDGDFCRPVQAVARNVLRIIDVLPFGYLVGWIPSLAGGRQQRLGDRVARTIVLYDRPLALQLQQSRVPASFFSTSEDGYLLEAWEARRHQIDPNLEMKLARDLALYLHERYGEAGPAAMQAFEAEKYQAYLEHLLAEERAGSGASE